MPVTKIEGMTVTAFAREMGVNEATVRDRVKSGRMSKAVLPDGSLDPEMAKVLWWKNTNPNRLRKPVAKTRSALADAAAEAEDPEGAGSEYDLKVRRMAVDLEAAEINLETLRKTTVKRVEAVRAVRALMRMHRNVMTNFASRYGPEIAAECGADQRTLVGALEARIRTVLNEAASQPLPFEGDDDGEPEVGEGEG